MTGSDGELVIEIREGDRARTVPVASLAAVFRLPSTTIRTALARLLFASSDRDAMSESTPTREPTEGVRVGRSETDVSYGSQTDNSPRRERDDGERGGAGEGGAPLDAADLAAALDDHAHLTALAALVAQHPAARLHAALTITLARPASSIRGTRGAYFTGVLRALAAREGAPAPSHDRTFHRSAD